MRADDVATKSETMRLFMSSGSGRVLTGLVIGAAVCRFIVGGPSLADVAVVVIAGTLVGPIEWVIHKFLLHGDTEAWSYKTLGVGAGHRQHHIDPPDVAFLLLPGREAAVFAVVLGVFGSLWAVPIAVLFGASTAGTALSVVVVAWVSLWHYEWVHLLVHTRYRPRSRLYARLARHHRLHHFRNENYWLGVTSNLGDRVARTLPTDRTAVPISPTAHRPPNR